LLIAWDGLTITAAADVAGCRDRAFRARLTRARAHLQAALDPSAASLAFVEPAQEPTS
jgi:DNA-directed RNA polymerase specialized sigma24 family protein